MNKLKSFFIGILLCAITFATVFLTVLIYRANKQISIETYIFQMDNSPFQRLGPLENMATMRPEALRNKLIQKYIAEYFKVIPGENNPGQENNVQKLSSKDVYSGWLNGEAEIIKDMAQQKMFRNVWVDPINIKPTDEPNLLEVHYATRTWQESNNMTAPVVDDFGTVLLQITFEPGFKESVNIKSVRDLLKNGGNPAKLFKFRVENIQKI